MSFLWESIKADGQELGLFLLYRFLVGHIPEYTI